MGSPLQVYWVKQIDNSRLVRQRDPRTLRETAGLLAAAGLCGALLLLCAWQQFRFVHSGYRLEEIQGRHEQVLDWNRTLRLEQAALLDPMRIEVLARRRLGLEAPTAGQLVFVRPGEGPVSLPVLARLRPAGPPVAGAGYGGPFVLAQGKQARVGRGSAQPPAPTRVSLAD